MRNGSDDAVAIFHLAADGEFFQGFE